MKEMKFEYLGKTYDLFEDGILSPENFLPAEDSELGVDIVLRHGVKEVADFFGFKDYATKILQCTDTQTFGTVVAVQQTMIRPVDENNPDESVEDRLFVGTGEVNGHNFKNFKICYPVAMAEKRARSRAVFWELGLNICGEEEAESFGEAVRKKRGGGFTPKQTAQYRPKNDPAPTTRPVRSSSVTTEDKTKAKEGFANLKHFAEENGLGINDVVKVLKSKDCFDTDDMVTIDLLATNLEMLDVAKEKLGELAKVG